jgi:RNA polymerase sigma factor (sigma-70 family)
MADPAGDTNRVLIARALTGDESALAALFDDYRGQLRQLIVQEALNGMDPIDREVLALRHFEHLSNDETARVLGLTKSAASNRYIRALKRLKEILSSIPGLREQL